MLPRYIGFYLLISLLEVVIPLRMQALASNPIKLWSDGRYKQIGPVKVTGLPGKNYYKQDGLWTYWYRNGQMQKSGSFTEGTETGWWEYWYDNGIRRKMGNYNNQGKEDGLWKYWYKNGLEYREGSYKDGLPDGHWVVNYNQVEHPCKEEGNFIKGEKDGYWVYYYKNGHPEKSGCYIKGGETGPWKYWYEDGQIKSEGCYKYGLEAGDWTYWDRIGDSGSGEIKMWNYLYTELYPLKEHQGVYKPSQALKGHWLSRKVLANFKRSQLEPEDLHHLYFGEEGNFLEVRDGGFIDGVFNIEDENPVNRTIQFRVTRSNGKGAVLFAIFSKDYCKLAGMYYLVDFLRGSRGGTTNYFLMYYAGQDQGPSLP